MNLLNLLGGNIAQTASDYFSKKAQIKHEENLAELENKKALSEAEVAAIREGRSLDNLWELESLKNQGWKDEFWTILFAGPVFLCFIPKFAPYIKAGFQILETATPDWYRWMLLVIVGAAFGVRVWRRL